jgi:diphthamide biosynthesis enzyme Dph1/Dph2-like protein
VGIIQGLLGRQGNPLVVQGIINALEQKNIKYTVILISEIFP